MLSRRPLLLTPLALLAPRVRSAARAKMTLCTHSQTLPLADSAAVLSPAGPDEPGIIDFAHEIEG